MTFIVYANEKKMEIGNSKGINGIVKMGLGHLCLMTENGSYNYYIWNYNFSNKYI
jgi:hypothetical protein